VPIAANAVMIIHFSYDLKSMDKLQTLALQQKERK
jgi:hypothetical protein